jgi:hypothetical protein
MKSLRQALPAATLRAASAAEHAWQLRCSLSHPPGLIFGRHCSKALSPHAPGVAECALCQCVACPKCPLCASDCVAVRTPVAARRAACGGTVGHYSAIGYPREAHLLQLLQQLRTDLNHKAKQRQRWHGRRLRSFSSDGPTTTRRPCACLVRPLLYQPVLNLPVSTASCFGCRVQMRALDVACSGLRVESRATRDAHRRRHQRSCIR